MQRTNVCSQKKPGELCSQMNPCKLLVLGVCAVQSCISLLLGRKSASKQKVVHIFVELLANECLFVSFCEREKICALNGGQKG